MSWTETVALTGDADESAVRIRRTIAKISNDPGFAARAPCRVNETDLVLQ
jgi:hypothetical protein